MLKKLSLIALSALAVPIGIAFIGGVGFILLNLLLGVSLEDSFQTIQSFQTKIQPYLKYTMIFIAIPLVVMLVKR
ncbi:hypothetical protein ACRC6Q_08410 [Planococcus sp. SE5232]|uniref:hypothetical protein n=1 Tax=unclassified Planococcus (in: firmicutes) TaxID=2662419 RepID=UPI003D6A878B